MSAASAAGLSASAGLSVSVDLAVGEFRLVAEFNVEPGEVLAVLGPNGAGKSTLLRALAGIQVVDKGRVTLDGDVLFDSATSTLMPPAQRPVGMMFQDYLLFPHLSVGQNVAFGPRSRGASKKSAFEVAGAWLDRVGLASYVDSKPAELSGGQSQRVALARALANDPRLLLLDEPLSALDASTRPSTRRDLRRHLNDFGGVTVLVTHDPVDVLTLADKVLVLEAGEVTQTGTVGEMAAMPRTPYVADLLGVNLLRGVASRGVVRCGDLNVVVVTGLGDGADGGEVLVMIRPQAISLHSTRPDTSARNVWQMTVADVVMVGSNARVTLTGLGELVAEVTTASVAELGLVSGREIWASVKATEVVAYGV